MCVCGTVSQGIEKGESVGGGYDQNIVYTCMRLPKRKIEVF